MEDKLVVSKWEVTLMLVNLFCLKAITAYPAFLKTLSGTGAWLGAICGSLLAFIITGLITLLYRKYSENSYPELLYNRFGSFVSGVIVGLAVISLITAFSFFVDFIAKSLFVTHFPMTPKWLLCLLLILPAMHGAYKGVGASIRVSALVSILMLILFGITFISVMGSATGINLFPAFGKDFPSFFKGVLFSMTLFSDFFLLLFLMPNIQTKKHLSGVWFKTILISSIVFVLTVIMVQASFMPKGYEAVSAIDRAEAYVKIGRYYARTERLFSIIWIMSYLSSFCVYYSFVAELVKALTKFDRRFIIVATGVIVYIITLGAPPLSHIMTWLSFLWLVLPLFTALKKGERKL